MTHIAISIHLRWQQALMRTPPAAGPAGARHQQPVGRRDAGQATVEYALVLLAVAAIALAVVAWAGGTSKITELLDAVLNSIISDV